MVESQCQSSRLPMEGDLVAGHVHARPIPDTAVLESSPRVKRRLRTKTSMAEMDLREEGHGFPSCPG